MIHREQDRAFLNQALLMQHAKAEKQTRNQLRERVNRPVIRVHALIDLHPLALQLSDNFANHAVDRKIGTVDDVSVLRDDERRRAAR